MQWSKTQLGEDLLRLQLSRFRQGGIVGNAIHRRPSLRLISPVIPMSPCRDLGLLPYHIVDIDGDASGLDGFEAAASRR